MPEHLAIFGGGRMIGPPLVHAAADNGWRITVVNRRSPPPAELDGVRHLAGDRGDPETIERLVALRPDVVVDLSCYEPEHVKLALQAFVGRAERYILMSSAAVYAPSEPLPWTESQPLGGDPLWGAYGAKKLANERIADEYAEDIPIAVLRAPYIVGHPDFMGRLHFIADRVTAESAVFVSDTGRSPVQLVSPTDVAGALMHLCTTGVSNQGVVTPYNIGNSQFASLQGLVQLLAKAMNRSEPEIVPINLHDVGLSNSPFSWTDMVFPFADKPYVLDDMRLRATGFRPSFDLDGLLADFVDHYQRAGGPQPPNRYPAEIHAISIQSTYRGA